VFPLIAGAFRNPTALPARDDARVPSRPPRKKDIVLISLKPAAVLAVLASLIGAPSCWAASGPAKNILVVYEGWDQLPSNQMVGTQLQKVFDNDKNFEEQVFPEYMDEWRLGPSLREIAEYLRHKYATRKIDLILAVGFHPFEFLMKHGAKVFPGVPVVFINVGDFELPEGGVPANMTGLTAHADVTGTVDLALHLQPETRHLFVVSGSSDYERQELAQLKPQLDDFAGRLKVEYLSDLTLEQLLDRVSQLPDHSAIFFLTMLNDPEGRSYVPATVCSLVSFSANAPVYAILQTDMDRGIVGGSIHSTEKNAEAAARLGIRVLLGADPKDLPVSPGPPHEVTVDWRQLQRWRIPESHLPEHAVVMFQPETWHRYGGYFVAAMIVVLLQALFILALWRQVRKRTLAERNVKRRLEFETLVSEVSARFINLSPERFSEEIERSLDRVRSFLNVDRIAFYGRSRPGMDFQALHYASVEKKGLAYPSIREAQFPWGERRMQQERGLLVENVDDLPAEAAAEREVGLLGIKSFAVTPLNAGGAVVGLLVLSSTTKRRGWPEELVRQLQILGDIFQQAVMRKRAEEAARESEARFALVADSAPMLVWMSGTDKLCTYFNKGWLDFRGRTLEQELGEGWIAGIHPEDLERLLSNYAQAFQARSEFRQEYRLRRNDGQYRWILDFGVPRYCADGSFCGYIGSCIDITDLKASQQEMEELSGRLIHAQEEERKRVARELHDNFGQRLVVLSMQLAQHLSKPDMPPLVEAWLRDLSVNLKEISRAMNVTAHQLHSAHLEVLGLVSAVQGLCNEFSRQYGIEVAFSQINMPSAVSAEVALCLFRVLQESLQNIAKHSGALSCRVELAGSAEGIHLCIVDTGIGFDVARLKLKPGLGFVSMRERLRLVGGQINIDSQPTRGTRLDIQVPLAAMTTAA
jgi:PAS domain S-box-containing protein